MLFRIIKNSFVNQKKAMAVMIIAVSVGSAIAASLLSLSMDISTKVSKELRAFGANILVEPRVQGLASIAGQSRYLKESDLVKIKTIFWRHNILGFVPFLYLTEPVKGYRVVGTWYKREIKVPGETTPFKTGASDVMPWWQIEGRWPEKKDEALIGRALSEKTGLVPGKRVKLFGRTFRITGVIDTGAVEDEAFVVDLDVLQELSGLSDAVSKVYVSALTTPMDDFAYKDPEKMSTKEYEKWYCTGYVTSIAKQIEEVVSDSVARPIWPVAQTEGRVLKRLGLLIYLLSGVSVLASALGVSTTMIMSLMRRTREIALMKALGADRLKTISIFLTESVLIGIAGGMLGYLASVLVSKYIGIKVFGTALSQRALLFPISLGASVIISVLGAYLPIRKALSIRPAIILKGE